MNDETTQDAAQLDSPYEPPRVETVLAADDLAREIQYAGTVSELDGVAG